MWSASRVPLFESRAGPDANAHDGISKLIRYAEELKEIAFGWVWNNNFAEYFMGNYIPPVTNSSEIYVSDDGVSISVDLLRARYVPTCPHRSLEN